ncbi:MAG: hypothetical protein FWE11_07130 [Defluviitaleaceae bacterium]|nr:hypothetical protein [Defluviitaleaceae bacterium]
MCSKVRKLIALTLIMMLAGIIFTACGSDTASEEDTPTEAYAEATPAYSQDMTATTDTVITAYHVLDSEFHALEEVRELTMTAETRFDLIAVDGAVLYVTTSHIRTDGLDEVAESHLSRDRNGAWVSEIEMILTGGMAYMDINSALYLVMVEMLSDLASLGLSMEDVPFVDIVGPYTHMQYWNEMTGAAINEERLGIYGAFTDEVLEHYLSQNSEGVFRIDIAGESVGNYIKPVLEAMSLDDVSLTLLSLQAVADIDDSLWVALEDDFAGWLRGGNLSSARLVIERAWTDGNTAHQNIELYIPGRISLRQDGTVVVGRSTPITAPSQFLTGEELGMRIMEWIMSLMEEPGSEMPSSSESDIRDVASFWVELDNVRFAVGQTVADFEETKFEVAPHQQEVVAGNIAANTITSITFQYQTSAGRIATFTAGLINPFSVEIPMRDAIIRTIVIDSFTTRLMDSNLFIEGIIIGETTQEEVIALFGEPDDSQGTTIMYRSPNWAGFTGSSAEFTFSDAILSGVRFMSYDV